MRILLINPPREGEVGSSTSADYITYDFLNYPPLGLLAIGAYIKPSHVLRVLDTVTKNMTIEQTVEYIKEYKPDALGISIVTRRLFPAYAVCKKVKGLLTETKIIAGGPHIDCYPTETMQSGWFDYALTGYGEERFSDLIEAIEKGKGLEDINGLYYKAGGDIKVNSPYVNDINLDRFLFPDRNLINPKDYFSAADRTDITTMYSSRGCPHKCIFCNVSEKTFHYRSAEKIVDEFEDIISRGIKSIHIVDDTFNLIRQRVIDMCNEILKRGLKVKWSVRARIHPFDEEMLTLMKRSGCARIHVGVESLDPHTLKVMKKGITLDQIHNFFACCNKVKIDTLAFFIVGFLQETEEYRKGLFEKIIALGPTYILISVLYPIVKSEFYGELLRTGILEKDYWEEFIRDPVYDFELPPWRGQKLQSELVKLADDIHRKFYLSPKFIISELTKVRSFRKLCLKTRVAANLFFNR